MSTMSEVQQAALDLYHRQQLAGLPTDHLAITLIPDEYERFIREVVEEFEIEGPITGWVRIATVEIRSV